MRRSEVPALWQCFRPFLPGGEGEKFATLSLSESTIRVMQDSYSFIPGAGIFDKNSSGKRGAMGIKIMVSDINM